jgi:hypothetical protein
MVLKSFRAQTHVDRAMDIGTAVFVIGGLMMILPALYAAMKERAVWQLIEGNPDKALQILRSDTACIVDDTLPWHEKAEYTGPFRINLRGKKTSFFIKSDQIARVCALLMDRLSTV